MDEVILSEVLEDWNFWSRTPVRSVKRTLVNELPRTWRKDLVWVIQGVRRCGKSTLLQQIMLERSLDPKRCVFFNFEDPRIAGNLDHGLLETAVAWAEMNLGDDRSLTFFFDEIQNVKGWEKWFHLQTMKQKHHFVVTGSNATLLGGKLATALTGRHLTFELFPLSWPEYQNFCELFRANQLNGLDEYLREGGFPGVLFDERPAELLRTYFTDIIERDVRRHVAARSAQSLIELARAVFESSSSELSFRTLAKRMDIAMETVKSYIDALESAYLILRCPFFSYSERQRMVRPSKYYPIDTAMRRAVVTKTGGDLGKQLETVVYHKLRTTYGEVAYWKGRGEIDFVVREGSTVVPIQVTWDAPHARHLNAAVEFKSLFSDSEPARIISRSNVEELLLCQDLRVDMLPTLSDI